MASYDSTNTFKFTSRHGFNGFMGQLRGMTGWNLYEASDCLHGKLEPELAGHKFSMTWVLEKSGGDSVFHFIVDGSELNARTKDSDIVWQRLDELYFRYK
jgi:hypothetical protein